LQVAFSAITFQPGQIGGMEIYFRNLLSALQENDLTNQYSLLCDRHYIDELPLGNPGFKAVPCNFTKPSIGWFLRGVIRNTVKIDILRPIMNRLQVDVIHHPFSILNPLHLTIPSVLTFHDMQHEFFPEYFSSFEMKVRNEFFRLSAEQATRIIAISEHAKSTLVEKYGVTPEKIEVIYNGYNSSFRIIDDPDLLEKVRSRYGLNRPFLYYPAATLPHKNHKTLFAALKLLRDRHHFDGQLVLSGAVTRVNSAIMQEIGRMGLEDTVKVLGRLPHDDLPFLYNLARVMAFPSLFEGFGLPLIEAMACGCPVACSNVTSMPEVIGDAGVTFDPASVEDVAEKIFILWEDEAQREALRGRGLQRAQSRLFSWVNTARETIKVYEKAAAANDVNFRCRK
jgi:glycosyltransferase involved in cell wall biosynthesis